jgi:hypothetical protein
VLRSARAELHVVFTSYACSLAKRLFSGFAHSSQATLVPSQNACFQALLTLHKLRLFFSFSCCFFFFLFLPPKISLKASENLVFCLKTIIFAP